LNLQKEERCPFVLKVKSVHKKVINIYITDLESYRGELINTENIFVVAFFQEVLIGLFFYNLFLYFSVKDKNLFNLW